MKFKVLKGTELFEKLSALGDNIKECDNKSFELAKELGFKNCYGKSFLLAGGLYGLIPIDGKTKPEGYAWAFNDRTGNAVMPIKNRKANKEIIDKIDSLPTVEYDELNNLVNYHRALSNKPNETGGTRFSFHPAINWTKEFILIDVPVSNGRKYRPAKDMVEILESEYQKLKKEK